MNADFIVSMGVFTDKDQNGELIITDALFGLEMIGEVIYNVDVQIGIEEKYVTTICEGYDSCHVVVVQLKIVHMKHSVKIFPKFSSFYLCFPFAVANILLKSGTFFVQFR